MALLAYFDRYKRVILSKKIGRNGCTSFSWEAVETLRSFDTIEANLVTDRAKFPTTVWFSTRKKNSWKESSSQVSTFPL